MGLFDYIGLVCRNDLVDYIGLVGRTVGFIGLRRNSLIHNGLVFVGRNDLVDFIGLVGQHILVDYIGLFDHIGLIGLDGIVGLVGSSTSADC